MIGTRTATALAFLLSIVAVAVGVLALAIALRDDESESPLLQTRIDRVDGPPVAFPLHDFYLSSDARGVPLALYIYPPGYYGHVRGCRVVWVTEDAVQTESGLAGPGLFVDPCGGARFDREGRLIAGEADRGLDRFDSRTEIGGALVDLSQLICGTPSEGDQPVVPAQSPTTTPAPPPSPPGGTTPPPPATAGPSATATVTPPPTATPTATASLTREPTVEPEKCERVERAD